MSTHNTAGLLAALMTGAPLPIPSIPCALCLVNRSEVIRHMVEPTDKLPRVENADTLAAGWLVCLMHARSLAHQLDNAELILSGFRQL